MRDLKAMKWLDVRNTNKICIKNVGVFNTKGLNKVYVQEEPFALFDARGKQLEQIAFSFTMKYTFEWWKKYLRGQNPVSVEGLEE